MNEADLTPVLGITRVHLLNHETGRIERTRNLDLQERIVISRDMVHAADFILAREMGA